MKVKITIGLLLALLALAFVTKPSEEDHKALIEQNFKDYIEQMLQDSSSQGGSLGEVFVNSMVAVYSDMLIKQIVNKGVKVDDYIFFNRSRVTLEGKTLDITIGAFGQVFPDPDLEEEMKKFFNEPFPQKVK